MDIQESAELQIIPKEAYLSRLSETDRNNLLEIGKQFKQVMENEGRKGAIIAVGGSLNKPLPRKDIDVLLVLQPSPTDVVQGNSTELDFALNDFQTFKHIIEEILTLNPSLQIKEIIEPTMDEEFNSPSILKTDGSITVINKIQNAMPVEFIRMRERGKYQEITAQNLPFVTLEEV